MKEKNPKKMMPAKKKLLNTSIQTLIGSSNPGEMNWPKQGRRGMNRAQLLFLTPGFVTVVDDIAA